MQQRSLEWLEARKGKITASCAYILMQKGRQTNGWSKAAVNYRLRILSERLLPYGEFLFSHESVTMQWGIENEEGAIEVYKKITGLHVEANGFKTMATNPLIGASGDGTVYKNIFDSVPVALLEVKCPYNFVNYVKRRLREDIAPQHFAQMQLGMKVYGVERCDYVTFYPDHPLVIEEIAADKKYQDELVERCEKFLKEVERMEDQLNAA